MNEPEVSKSERWKNRLLHFRAGVRRAAPFIAGMAAAFLALVVYNLLFPAARPLTTREINDTVAQALASATPQPAYSARVYQAVRPSLILIQTKDTTKDGKEEKGLGSGVVIDDAGDILTSLHVVANATDIQLTFPDGVQSTGRVVATQPEHDIAVVRAEQPPDLVIPAVLGNPNAMRVGDEVFAVGNPFGLYSSLSAGVISGFNRTFQPESSPQKLEGMIQIDTAVNPGNSGGPLLNRDGAVIGIVTGIVNPTGEDVFIGIGFAVPINVAGGAVGSPPY
jgi:S1-C subfamily serine protease